MLQCVIRTEIAVNVKKKKWTLLQISPHRFLLFLFIALSVRTGSSLLLFTVQCSDNLLEGCALLFAVVGSRPPSRMDGPFLPQQRNNSGDFSTQTNKQKKCCFLKRKILPPWRPRTVMNRRSGHAVLGPPAGWDAPVARGKRVGGWRHVGRNRAKEMRR